MTKLLFVCTANICRSPTALFVARKMADDRGLGKTLRCESAGTHALTPPQRTDPRTVAALSRRGYNIKPLRSSRIALNHFAEFDLLLAMDNQNMAALQKICPPEHAHKLRLLLSYAPACGRTEVPDPYHSNAQAFDLVLDLCETAVSGLLANYRTL
jgi:protein-tyrosine phosphatase